MLSTRFVGWSAAAVAVLVAVVVVLAGRDDSSTRRLRVELSSATGLREGTLVRVHGAEVGSIARLSLGRADAVIADLDLDRRIAIGRDARVAIKTQNLLGESTVSLEPGSPDRPVPAGWTIPRRRVTSNVQLDQVVDMLDTGTRARLAVLVSEAGRALGGRAVSLDDLLDALPGSLSETTALLDALAGDTTTVRRTIEQADRFVTSVAAERRQLTATLRSTGEAMKTIGGRQAALRETLRRAPGALRTLQAFLADLSRATGPLGAASDALSLTASPLRQALDEVGPFRTAARPTLRAAVDVAPEITRLATGATPVLRRASPSLTSAAELLESAPPLTRAVDRSVDDLLGFMEGWARAIQQRDGISHVFRGRALVGTDAVRSLLASLPGPEGEQRRRPLRTRVRPAAPRSPGARRAPAVTPPPAAPGPQRAPAPGGAPPATPFAPLQELPKALGGLLDGLLGRTPTPRVGETLDHLLKP